MFRVENSYKTSLHNKDYPENEAFCHRIGLYSKEAHYFCVVSHRARLQSNYETALN